MTSVPITLSRLHSDDAGLTAGKRVAVVVAMGRAASNASLGAVSLEGVPIANGAMLEVVLLDATSLDPVRLGSGIVQYFEGSGGRAVIDCLVPINDQMNAVLEIGLFDPV